MVKLAKPFNKILVREKKRLELSTTNLDIKDIFPFTAKSKNLSRIRNCLRSVGINTVGSLVDYIDHNGHLLEIRNFGENLQKVVVAELAKLGIIYTEQEKTEVEDGSNIIEWPLKK